MCVRVLCVSFFSVVVAVSFFFFVVVFVLLNNFKKKVQILLAKDKNKWIQPITR